MYKIYLIVLLIACFASAILSACNGDNHDREKKVVDTLKINSPKVAEKPGETKRGPVINIADTLSVKRMLLTMKDSAATLQGVSKKLADIYSGKLSALIKKNKLKISGAPVAWYKSEKPPYFFEAGIPVDKKPSNLPKGVFVKTIGSDSIVVAHFYGPYELIPQAYDALKDWMKEHKKRSKNPPYEIYVDDAVDASGKLKDPYKVQTDVVFSWR